MGRRRVLPLAAGPRRDEGLEVVGHESRHGEDPSADIRSRLYGFSMGETPDYSYEVVEDTLTI